VWGASYRSSRPDLEASFGAVFSFRREDGPQVELVLKGGTLITSRLRNARFRHDAAVS
jgi:hypothetical protein